MVDFKKKFIIIDGSALLHRAFHALPPLSTKEGKLINAAYGFTSVLIKIFKELQPSHIAVTFDLAAPTFRHKEFKEYKAQRAKQPQELYDQIPLIEEVLKALRIPIYTKEGFEADDIIATICKENEKKNNDTENIILTGDLDALQLVNNQTKVLSFRKGISDTILYDRDKVVERYGLEPEQMIDYKALRGDPSDNIPGVRGIGEKTATELIKKFGSLEGIYKNLEKDSKEIKLRTREILKESKEDAEQSKRLVTLVDDIPTGFTLEETKLKEHNIEKISEIFNKLGFQSLLKRIFAPTDEKKTLNAEIQTISQKKLDKVLEKIYQSKVLYFKIVPEVESRWYFGNKARYLFLNANGDVYKVDLTPPHPPLDKGGNGGVIASVFNNKDILKIGYDIKKEISYLENSGVMLTSEVDNFWDILIASYLVLPGRRDYPLEDIKSFPGLYKNLLEQTKKDGLEFILNKIEMPLVKVLAQMEKNGILLDVKFLKKMSAEIKEDLKKLEIKIYKQAGQEFNIKSPQQLKTILFDKFELHKQARLRRTKTGISTAAPELIKMRGLHPIIDSILEYRELFKLCSTYIEALPKLVNPKTKRIHTNFHQTITATGRLSSSEPNLQNIPIRTPLGQKIRKAFVAEKGYVILNADYSQIELRIVAHLANDKEMIGAFNRKEDIHIHTAALVNNILENKVTKEMRRFAKAVNFGIVYGMGPQSLAESTGMSFEEAKQFIEQYFYQYKGVRQYVEETKVLANKLGYAETLFGRRRYLPEITSNIRQLQAMAERMAINHPVQGTAADLIKMAMIEINKEAQKRGWENQIKMLLQVHDELVFEVKKDFIKKAASTIKEKMENVYKLRVPLEVDIKTGRSWGELSKIKN